MAGLERIASARAIETMLDVKLQLERTARPGFRPIVVLLNDARERAEAAMVQLCIVPPHDADKIRVLQNEIIRFDDMVRSVKRMIEVGEEADRRLAEEDRAEVEQIISASLGLGEAERLGATEVNDR